MLAHDYARHGTPEDQAGFEMANLRPATTGLPFVVWVSQRGNISHDLRVKVGYNPRLFPEEMGSYAVRPFGFTAGKRLRSADEVLLQRWVILNLDVLVGFWDGTIEYTEDMIERIVPLTQ